MTQTDTAPNTIEPEALPGYEHPPAEGETQREKRNRKARNRRLAERHAAATAPEPPARPVGRPAASTKRATAVTSLVTMVGIGVLAVEPHDGQVIIEGAADLGQSLAALAEKNSKVARAIDSLTEASAWAEVAAAVGAIALPIIKHHARRPEPLDLAAEAAAAAPEASPVTTNGEGLPVFRATHVDPRPEPVPTFQART